MLMHINLSIQTPGKKLASRKACQGKEQKKALEGKNIQIQEYARISENAGVDRGSPTRDLSESFDAKGFRRRT